MAKVYTLRMKALDIETEAVVAEEAAKEWLRAEGVNPILRRRLEKLREKIGRVRIVDDVARET